MATYASLTAGQKATVAHALDTMARPALGEYARLLNHFAAFKSEYDAGAAAIIATVDVGEVIPNSSGLAGANDMTQAQWTTFVTAINTLLTTYNTTAMRQSYALAAGGPNLIG